MAKGGRGSGEADEGGGQGQERERGGNEGGGDKLAVDVDEDVAVTVVREHRLRLQLVCDERREESLPLPRLAHHCRWQPAPLLPSTISLPSLVQGSGARAWFWAFG